MLQLHLYVLGAPRLEQNGNSLALSHRKTMALYVHLAVTAQVHRRDLLASLLWPEHGQTAARAALRRELHTLTNTVNPEGLIVTRDTIQANAAVTWVDLLEFRRLLATWRAHQHPNGTLCDDCFSALTAASELFSGEFLAGYSFADLPEFEAWYSHEADAVHQEFAALAQQLIYAYEQQNRLAPAIELARRWLALDAMHEPVHQTLMKLYALDGQPTAAIRQYQECVRILDEDLGIAPTAETTVLYNAIRTRQYPPVPSTRHGTMSTDTAVSTLDTSGGSAADGSTVEPLTSDLGKPNRLRHNLPTPATSFIGRQLEVDAVIQLLRHNPECRMLTVIGPGGIGKTRLALQVAQMLVDTTATDDEAVQQSQQWNAICFAPLAAVTDAADLLRALADALGYQFRGNDEPQVQLEQYLRGQNILLVLDNFEQLLAGAAQLSALLRAAPGLTLLITSRESLAVSEEWLYPLGGLPVPERGMSPAELATNSAVQLFVTRAQRVAKNFSLSAQNADPVAAVCRLVDGMPLGVELAAAWANIVTVDELAVEIADNLDILASDLRNIPARHRSLRAVFEQTWSRLTVAERQTLCRLAVFRGTFTRDAAQQVADATLLEISSLVNKSLCRRHGARYDIHELLRQFAAERMDVDEQQAIQARHSYYYDELLAGQSPHVMTAAELQMLQTIGEEFDNIIAAWRYLVARLPVVTERAQTVMCLSRCAPILAVYIDRRSLFWEGIRLFQDAITALQQVRDGSEPVAESVQTLNLLLQVEQIGIWMHLGGYYEAKEKLSDLLPVLRTTPGMQQLLAKALTYLGPAHMRIGEYSAAVAVLQEALAVYEALGLGLESTIPLINLGLVKTRQEEFAAARDYYQRAVAFYEKTGYATGLARCLSNIGSTFPGKANITQAIAYFERAYPFAEKSQNQLWIAIILTNLADCAATRGDNEIAREKFAAGLAIFREQREVRWITINLAESSFPLIALHAFAHAAAQLVESLTLAHEYQLYTDGLVALAAAALLCQRQAQFDAATTLAAHVCSDPRTRGDMQEFCTTLLAELEALAAASTAPAAPATSAVFTAATYADLRFKGESTPFDQMVQYTIQLLEQGQ